MAGPEQSTMNPWSALMSGDVSSLHSAGMDALQSGKISPEEAMQNYQQVSPVLKALGITGQGPFPSAKKQAAKKPTYATNANVVEPGSGGAIYNKVEVPVPQSQIVPKGSGLANSEKVDAKASDEATNMSGNKTTRQDILMLGDPQFQEAYNRGAKSPAIQEQIKGVNKIQDMLSMDAQAPSDYLSGPIAGLLQSEFGRNASIMNQNAGMTPEAKRLKLIQGMDKLQGDKRDISKTISDYIAKQKAGSITDLLYAQAANKLGNTTDVTNTSSAVDPNKYIKSGPKAYDPNKDIQKLGADRAKFVAPMLNSLDAIDKELGDQGGLSGLRTSAVGVQGVGGLNTLLPIGIRDDKGAKIYNYAKDLAMAKLQMRSGAQASEGEAARYLQQFGLTPTSSGREMATGLNKLVDDVQRTLGGDEARFPKEAVSKYSTTPGRIMSTDLNKYKQPSKPQGKAIEDMSNDELKVFIKNGGKL